MTTHTGAKHNPDICPICQKEAHQREEDERWEKWLAEYKELGGTREGLGECVQSANSFYNDLTPEQAVQRQQWSRERNWKKLKQNALFWAIVVGLIIVVSIVRGLVV